MNDVMRLCVYLHGTCEPWLPCMAKCIPAVAELFLARCRGEPAIITREHTKPLIATYRLFTALLSGSCWFHGYLFRWECSEFSLRCDTHTHVHASMCTKNVRMDHGRRDSTSDTRPLQFHSTLQIPYFTHSSFQIQTFSHSHFLFVCLFLFYERLQLSNRPPDRALTFCCMCCVVAGTRGSTLELSTFRKGIGQASGGVVSVCVDAER